MKLEQLKAVMLGHAVGDALGVPVQFAPREERDEKPVTDMQGFGIYPFPAGAWSDDTSMSLCALDSLSKGNYDPDDIMHNFGRWYYKDEFTPTGKTFDEGNTCSCAIENYFEGKLPVTQCGLRGERSNGNGSLMRIHPVALFLADSDLPVEEKIKLIHSASAITHAHVRAMIGCGIYSFVLWELLKNPRKAAIRDGLHKADKYYRSCGMQADLELYSSMLFRRIGWLYIHFEDYDSFHKASRDEIKSSGYVVHTLEAAIWCLMNTGNYRDCVLTAVNLGDDSDTVAAVAGGLAGALYGCDAIPIEWLDTLIKHEYIEELCERAFSEWNTHVKEKI